MSKKDRFGFIVCVAACVLVPLASCGLLSSAPAKSALEVVAPIAAKALTKMINDRYGAEVDQDSAGCYELPEFTTDENGFEYVICRAKPIGDE